MVTPGIEKVVAFLDLGTNSVRLLVVRLNTNYSYSVLTQQKEPIRLGEGEFEEDLLTDDAIERTVRVCGRLVELARAFGTSEIVAVATSATREARNRGIFLRRLSEEAGLDVKVISGEEEARLIYRGVASGIELGDRKALFIDIGGGSTEVSIGDAETYSLLKSLKLGAIRLTNHFFPDGAEGPVEEEYYATICNHIRDTLIHTVQKVKNEDIDFVVGSSGTIENLQQIAHNLYHPDEEEQGLPKLSRKDLRRLRSTLCLLPLAERRRISGINPDRGDIIIAGAAIIETFMEELGIKEIQVSDRSLRNGLLADYLSKVPGFPHAEETSTRRRSVTQLGRSCQIDEVHARTVTKIALALFDSAGEAGLHSFGVPERELLDYAAFLHDIGQFISFSGHHNHSRYIISHAPLLGFDQREIEMLAQICRYHRKKVPKVNDPALRDLDPEAQSAIRVLSTLLRLAEHLDRSHSENVLSAHLVQADKHTVRLEITCRGDCSLEVWAVESDTKAFSKVMHQDLQIVVGHAHEDTESAS